jgi:hypothetical protein
MFIRLMHLLSVPLETGQGQSGFLSGSPEFKIDSRCVNRINME